MPTLWKSAKASAVGEWMVAHTVVPSASARERTTPMISFAVYESSPLVGSSCRRLGGWKYRRLGGWK
jgi:hypothetical protein